MEKRWSSFNVGLSYRATRRISLGGLRSPAAMSASGSTSLRHLDDTGWIASSTPRPFAFAWDRSEAMQIANRSLCYEMNTASRIWTETGGA
jgi:hypothetical protein